MENDSPFLQHRRWGPPKVVVVRRHFAPFVSQGFCCFMWGTELGEAAVVQPEAGAVGSTPSFLLLVVCDLGQVYLKTSLSLSFLICKTRVK